MPASQPQPATDLLDHSRWRPLFQLLATMDRDIAALYERAGIADLRTRYVGPLIQLGRRDSMTVQELATSVEVSHSAMSQTVAAMHRAGFVDRVEGTDGRTRRVALSDRGRTALPFLQAEWRATEATVRDLETEIPYALSRAVRDIQAALVERPFAQRLAENLARALDGTLR